MYSPILWKHIRDPQNRTQLEGLNVVGRSSYDKCGDDFILQLKIENDLIQEAAFLARACGPVVAIGSVGTALLKGLNVGQALEINAFQLDKLLGGLPGPKRHAILLFLDSLHQAIEAYRSPTSQKNELERNT